MKSRKRTTNNNGWRLLRGVLLGLFITLLLILLFALALKLFDIGETAISPVNQGIKVVSILGGGIAAVWGLKQRGWLMGGGVGLLYMLAGYALYSFLQGSFSPTVTLATDSVMGFASGALAGIIGGNLRGKKER